MPGSHRGIAMMLAGSLEDDEPDRRLSEG
jgi:hypothetical protein